MATKDYTIIPAIVTITNVAVPVEVFDAGTKSIEVDVLDAAVRPGELVVRDGDVAGHSIVRRKYQTAERKIQLYKANSWITLDSLQVLNIHVASSDILAYFMSLASADITVTAAAVVVTP